MDFKDYINDKESVDEAYVQVQGEKKPSGALVLSKIILEELEKKNLLKFSSPNEKKKVISSIQELIIKSTF
tara:strand:+ start:1079 stop:1291 length:213 start_codon:yes stop_codon:yes gene_type:complete